MPLLRARRGEKWVYSVSQSLGAGLKARASPRDYNCGLAAARSFVPTKSAQQDRLHGWTHRMELVQPPPGPAAGGAWAPFRHEHKAAAADTSPKPGGARCAPHRPQHGVWRPVCCSAMGSCLSMRPSFGSGGVEGCSAPIRVQATHGFSRAAVAIITRGLEAA